MADDTTAALNKAIERGREELKITPPNGVPREPFVFSDPTEVEYFGEKEGATFTLYRTVDGIKFTYHNCKPVISQNEDGLVSARFDVTGLMVTWEHAK